jgi:hypothetical protein
MASSSTDIPPPPVAQTIWKRCPGGHRRDARSKCRHCNPSIICEHDKLKKTCTECHPELRRVTQAYLELEAKYDMKKLNLHIRRKISDCVKKDQRRKLEGKLSCEEVREVIAKSDGKCEYCGCTVLFDNYKPNCLHAFALGRHDKSQAHTKDNIRIVCFNCGFYGCRSPKPKGCVPGCHGPDMLTFRIIRMSQDPETTTEADQAA